MEDNGRHETQPLDETTGNFIQKIADFTRAIFGDNVVIIDTTSAPLHFAPDQDKKAS